MINIIKKPVISEKSMKLTKNGMFTFVVGSGARKDAIKKAVEGKFNVNVLSIKTMNFKSETKQQRSRKGIFEIAGYKKAIVTLKQGQKIAMFETESKEESSDKAQDKEIKEKKSLLKRTKVKIEKEVSSKNKQSLRSDDLKELSKKEEEK